MRAAEDTKKMMRHARLLVALPALFCLACPGDWDEPLGPAHGGHIDSSLVGEWRCQERGGKDGFRLSIVPFDKNQYVFVSVDPTNREPPGAMRAFTTTVSGHDVMNIQILGKTAKSDGWTYARLWFPQDGHLSIDPVRKEPLKDVGDDVESRRLAIGDLFSAPELWEDGYACVPFEEEKKPAS
jgi:hypothetical protein